MTEQHNDNDWLKPTQARLDDWGEVMRSIPSPIAGGCALSRHDERTLLVRGAEADSEVFVRVDRYLCQLKRTNPRAFKALFLYYYHDDKGNKQCADDMRIKLTQYRSLRQNGEVYLKALWDLETDGVVLLKKTA